MLQTLMGECPPPEENKTLAERQSRPIISPRTKTAAILRLFLERGERGLNCFEAARLGHDFVLRSTVSNLQIGHGIVFQRRNERVPGHGGSEIDCTRYWLDGGGRKKAAELLGMQTVSQA